MNAVIPDTNILKSIDKGVAKQLDSFFQLAIKDFSIRTLLYQDQEAFWNELTTLAGSNKLPALGISRTGIQHTEEIMPSFGIKNHSFPIGESKDKTYVAVAENVIAVRLQYSLLFRCQSKAHMDAFTVAWIEGRIGNLLSFPIYYEVGVDKPLTVMAKMDLSESMDSSFNKDDDTIGSYFEANPSVTVDTYTVKVRHKPTFIDFDMGTLLATLNNRS